MAARTDGRLHECVVVDLNTQFDFCSPVGISPVANIDALIPALRHVIAWTKRNQVPIVSSVESHRPCEFGDNGHPACCVDGTSGQRKIDFTLFPCSARVEVDNTLSCPMDLFKNWQQIIFRKRTEDLLGNPKADRFFTQLATRELILFGIGVEHAVKALALALLAREKRVTVVADACGYWNRATADLAIRQIMAKGATVIDVCELLRRKLDRRQRYPTRRRMNSDAGKHGMGCGRDRKYPPARNHPLRDRLPDASRKASILKPDTTARGDA